MCRLNFICCRDYYLYGSQMISFSFDLRIVIAENIVVISIITGETMKLETIHRDVSFEIVVRHLNLCPFVGSMLGAEPKSSFLIPFSFYEYQSITCFYIL